MPLFIEEGDCHHVIRRRSTTYPVADLILWECTPNLTWRLARYHYTRYTTSVLKLRFGGRRHAYAYIFVFLSKCVNVCYAVLITVITYFIYSSLRALMKAMAASFDP